jgi:ribosomal protein S12 methylthiotransferase accessory factor
VPDRAGPTANHRDSAPVRRDLQVTIAGHGLFATTISEALDAASCPAHVRACDMPPDHPSDLGDLVSDAGVSPDGQRLLVTASDGWDCRAYERVQALCVAHRTSWLPVRTELGQTVIGPCYSPGAPGCVTCAELRRSLADDQFAVRQSVRQRYPRLADQPSPWLTALTARTVAAVTAGEVIRWARSQSGRTRCVLLYVDLGTLAINPHRFLPDPLCPICGTLPADGPEAARIALRPRPKPAPGSYRVRQLGDADLDRLRETYVDEETGLIRRTETFASGSLAVGAATMRTRSQARAELSWGRTTRHRTSETVAVLEALERYGGMAPGGRRSVVRASFAEVRDTALDPRTLGLYAPEQYARPGFPFQPFDAGRVCRWVWGYSLARHEPILIPQAYAYYGVHRIDPDDPLFAFEISNGCALGSCLEEAILYGILEVVERDAFLMTWYARLPAAPIDLSSARDRSIPMLAQAIEAETGYRVLAFDITMEHSVPSVWAMAVGPPGTGQPALVCSAGAHLDPERAASGALCELGPILTDLIGRYPGIAERARAMVGDPSLVTTMDDHSVLYASYEASSRLQFLTPSGQSRSFADIQTCHGTADAFHNIDLTDDLTEMVRRLWQHGLDVIAVDQTTPEHRVGGFCCVKVIIPGALPMTFGHNNRRIHGLRRLLEAPKLLGHRDKALLPQDVNPHPHPFP